ncbi:MAG: NADH-quinone oxidoreductase subunit B [Bacillota bacterium]
MGLEAKLNSDGFLTTTIDSVIAWARKNSIWPMPMGISCCAIEMMASVDPKYDLSRFGSEVMRFSPRQSDLMIVAGTVTYKMAKVVRKIYDQMPDPKWVIAMGACTSSGGMYRSYSVVQGIDQFLPVDVYTAGCPPRPENLINAIIEVQKIIGKTRGRDFQDKPLLNFDATNN